MTVTEMQGAIGVSSNSYYNFMKQSGPTKGTMSDAYMGAFEFFKKRELAGLKMPRKKKAKSDSPVSKKDNAGVAGGRQKSKAGKEQDLDVSEIHLEGEQTDRVPIYLTCDDVRRQINDHLRNTSATQASFCRTVASMYTSPPSQGTKPSSLKTFLSAGGVLMGASSPIFYGSYVYFEKLRIKQNKPKSKKRREMEEVWGEQGMERNDMKQSVLMQADERILTDKYGHVEYGHSELHGNEWAAPEGWKVWRPTKM